MLVPFAHKRVQSLGQRGFVRKVGDHQPFALQDAEPLLHLIHPRAVNRRMVKLEAGMLFQPGLHLLAGVHSQVIHHQMDFGDCGGNLSIQLFQKLDELGLPFSFRSVRKDLAGPRIEGGEQVQSAFAFDKQNSSVFQQSHFHRFVQFIA